MSIHFTVMCNDALPVDACHTHLGRLRCTRLYTYLLIIFVQRQIFISSKFKSTANFQACKQPDSKSVINLLEKAECDILYVWRKNTHLNIIMSKRTAVHKADISIPRKLAESYLC